MAKQFTGFFSRQILSRIDRLPEIYPDLAAPGRKPWLQTTQLLHPQHHARNDRHPGSHRQQAHPTFNFSSVNYALRPRPHLAFGTYPDGFAFAQPRHGCPNRPHWHALTMNGDGTHRVEKKRNHPAAEKFDPRQPIDLAPHQRTDDVRIEVAVVIRRHETSQRRGRWKPVHPAHAHAAFAHKSEKGLHQPKKRRLKAGRQLEIMDLFGFFHVKPKIASSDGCGQAKLVCPGGTKLFTALAHQCFLYRGNRREQCVRQVPRDQHPWPGLVHPNDRSPRLAESSRTTYRTNSFPPLQSATCEQAKNSRVGWASRLPSRASRPKQPQNFHTFPS